MTQIVAYIFYFIASTASPLQRRWLATNKNHDNKGQIAFAFQITLLTSILSLVFLFFEPFYIQGSIYKIILLAIVCGMCGMLSYSFSFIAQKHIEAGISTLVSNIYTPITIILATVFLNEKLTNIQILGTILLILGIIVVSKKHRIGKFKFDKYFILMILSGVLLAGLLVAERALINMTGFSAGVIISWWVTCLFLGILTFITKNKSPYSKKDIFTTGILRFFQNTSWVILVFVVGNLSLVSSITTFKVVLMFILGAIFLNEKEDMKRKILGSVIALIGLLIMK